MVGQAVSEEELVLCFRFNFLGWFLAGSSSQLLTNFWFLREYEQNDEIRMTRLRSATARQANAELMTKPE
jgi:hypothetical protein